MEVKQAKIEEFKPYSKNAKQHPEWQINRLMKLIQLVGFDEPLIVDKDMTIIAGHGRLEAAKRLGLKELPFIMKDQLTAEQVRGYRVGHNAVAETSWDEAIKAEEAKELLKSMDMEELSSYFASSEQEIITLLNSITPTDALKAAEGVDQLYAQQVTCPKCGAIFQKAQ